MPSKKNVVMEDKQEVVIEDNSFEKNYPNNNKNVERLGKEWKLLIAVTTIIVIVNLALNLLKW